MIPASYTVSFTQGDDYRLPFKIRTAVWDVPTLVWVPGPAVDLTGWTGNCQFRPDHGQTPSVSAVITINPDQVGHKGECALTLTRANTLAIGDKWLYDIELIDTANFKETYIKGKVKLNLEVTV